MRVLTTARFDRAVKKLHLEEKKALDQAVRSVIAAPASGELKKGDLVNVRVHKYRFNKEQMLLAYAANLDEQVIILMGFGTHENFYNRSITELKGMFGKPSKKVSIDDMNKAIAKRGASAR